MAASHRPYGLALVLAFAVVSSGEAAPALGDKPTKWEYAEMTFTRLIGPATQKEIIVLTKLDGEIEAASWEDLADKLKAPVLKREGTLKLQKLRALNQLGTDGWELVEHSGDEDAVAARFAAKWVFKRRVP